MTTESGKDNSRANIDNPNIQLNKACQFGTLSELSESIANGADVDNTDYGLNLETPLMLVVNSKQKVNLKVQMIKELIKNGADPHKIAEANDKVGINLQQHISKKNEEEQSYLRSALQNQASVSFIGRIAAAISGFLSSIIKSLKDLLPQKNKEKEKTEDKTSVSASSIAPQTEGGEVNSNRKVDSSQYGPLPLNIDLNKAHSEDNNTRTLKEIAEGNLSNLDSPTQDDITDNEMEKLENDLNEIIRNDRRTITPRADERSNYGRLPLNKNKDTSSNASESEQPEEETANPSGQKPTNK